MKSKVRRTILLMLIAVILFSASMAIPALQGSQYKELVMGAGIGLMFAAVISSISAIVEYLKTNKNNQADHQGGDGSDQHGSGAHVFYSARLFVVFG